MILEAVTTCFDYGDYLKETLPLNVRHFDRMIVVTKIEDTETIEACRKKAIVCAIGDHGRWHSRTKGRLINLGLELLWRSGWIVHLDADTVLPNHFRSRLEEMALCSQYIYGAVRHKCPDWAAWQGYKKDGDALRFPSDGNSQLAVGFFQLFCAQAPVLSGKKPGTWYPWAPNLVSDLAFRARWGHTHIRDVGMPVVHLEHGAKKTNHYGRVSPRFEERL